MFNVQHVLCLWPEVHADVRACPLFHSVSTLERIYISWLSKYSALDFFGLCGPGVLHVTASAGQHRGGQEFAKSPFVGTLWLA